MAEHFGRCKEVGYQPPDYDEVRNESSDLLHQMIAISLLPLEAHDKVCTQILWIGDSGFAVLDLLAAVRRRCTVVSRLRLDANLYPPPRRAGHGRLAGRPASKGAPLPKLKAVAEARTTVWRRIVASEWYGDERCQLDIMSGTGMWYRPGSKIVPLRWVLVRDPIMPARTRKF
ncbi:hypothetical protein NKI50_28460 [Mesorhizobium sp. M0563]|uniref:hypothetical protein n=1 Tax=Mesorhizobium sp. M0563 TaxID=2956959 RepID=UPI00333B2DDA